MRDPKERLIDILDAIAKIERHTGVGETDFENRMHGIIVITHPDRVGAGLVPAQEGDHEGRLYDTDPDRTTGTGGSNLVSPLNTHVMSGHSDGRPPGAFVAKKLLRTYHPQ